MKIEIISGSARKKSVSVRVALALQKILQNNTQHHIGLIDCRDFTLPPLQEVISSSENAPDEFKSLSEKMLGADAFIWVTPEYNGSYTPALKNLVDYYPKILHKAVGIVTVSYGPLGGMRAAQQLILYAAAMFAHPCPQLLIVPNVDKKFSAEGNCIDELFEKNIQNFTTEFLWLAEALHSTKNH